LRAPVRRLRAEDLGVRFLDHVLAEQREPQPAGELTRKGRLPRGRHAIDQNHDHAT
jgi:hypothetical protein